MKKILLASAFVLTIAGAGTAYADQNAGGSNNNSRVCDTVTGRHCGYGSLGIHSYGNFNIDQGMNNNLNDDVGRGRAPQ